MDLNFDDLTKEAGGIDKEIKKEENEIINLQSKREEILRRGKDRILSHLLDDCQNPELKVNPIAAMILGSLLTS